MQELSEAKRRKLDKDELLSSAMVSGWFEELGAGQMSVVDVQNSALRATEEGCNSEAEHALARMGNTGISSQNLERDLHRLLQRSNLPLTHCRISWHTLPLRDEKKQLGMFGAPALSSLNCFFPLGARACSQHQVKEQVAHPQP